jgi:hypothetical protein
VTIPHSAVPHALYGPDETAAGQENDERFLWLAAGDLPEGENPYAPQWAWPGSTFTSERAPRPPVAAPRPSGGWADRSSRDEPSAYRARRLAGTPGAARCLGPVPGGAQPRVTGKAPSTAWA